MPLRSVLIATEPPDMETGQPEFQRCHSDGSPRKRYMTIESLTPPRIPITRSASGPHVIDEG